jgi:hypothetical protein
LSSKYKADDCQHDDDEADSVKDGIHGAPLVMADRMVGFRDVTNEIVIGSKMKTMVLCGP